MRLRFGPALLALSLLGLSAACRKEGDAREVPRGESASAALLRLLASPPEPRGPAGQAPSGSPPAEEPAGGEIRQERVDGMLESSNDGRWGYLLKLVDGPWLYRVGVDEVFEPASTVKTLLLLHAMREVDQGRVSLKTPIPWFRGSTVADDPATSDEDEREWGCPLDEDPAVGELGEGLRLMMERSDNRWTQAVRRYFGDAGIRETALLAGMRWTSISHRIGCAADTGGDPGELSAPGTSTLRELDGLLEGVAAGRLLSETGAARFFELMANDPLIRLTAILGEENAGVGLPQEILQAVASRIALAWKSGKYNIGEYKCQSVVALAILPVYAERAVRSSRYVVAVFVDDARRFPEQGTRESLYSLAVASELLRGEIRSMLLSFRAALDELGGGSPR